MADHNANPTDKAPVAGPNRDDAESAKPASKPRDHEVKGLFGRVSVMPPAPPPAGPTDPPSAPTAERDAAPIMSLFRGSAPLVMPPSPIFVPEAHESDPAAVALLFGTEQAVPAPSLIEPSIAAAPTPSQQPNAWRVVGSRTSLFDDHIKDPAPPPRVASPAPDDGPIAVAAPEPPPPAPRKAAGGPPPPPAAALAGKSAKPPPAKPAVAADPEPAAAPVVATPTKSAAAKASKTRKRRTVGGPAKGTLAALSVGSLLVIGVTGVLLGLLPNPFADSHVALPPPRIARPAVLVAKIQAPAPATAPVSAQATNAAATPMATAPKAATTPLAGAAAAATTPSATATTPRAATTLAAAAATARTPSATAITPKPAPTPTAAAIKAPAAPVAEHTTAAPTVPAQPGARPASPAAQATNTDEAGGGAEALVSAARKKLADDEPQAAEALLRQALAKDPQDHHAMELLAHALMDQDRGQEALPFARKIVQRRPHRIPYRLLLGDLLLMVGDEAHAKLEWEEARKLAPDDPQIKRRLGQ